MKFIDRILATTAACVTALAIPMPATAQPQSAEMRAQRSDDALSAATLRGSIRSTRMRIDAGERSGAVTRAGAANMRRQLWRIETGLRRAAQRPSRASAATLASSTRTWRAIEARLDRYGVARSYGDDALVASPNDGAPEFRYDCRNEPVSFEIPGDRLDAALGQFRLTTHCPVSGTALAAGKRSRPLVGTMTPMAGLQALLSGTGLQVREIKGGFQVVPLPR